MQPLTRGIYTARLAETPEDVAQALALRLLCFRLRRGQAVASDADRFDDLCQHILLTDNRTNRVVCCFRLMLFADLRSTANSYAAQFYDLSALQATSGPLMELGRFCLHPDHADPDILRLAWAMLTGLVDQHRIALLFGCSSFDGADPDLHQAALAYLARNHLVPQGPKPCAALTCDLRPLAVQAPAKMPAMPSLLRTYLGMGGWVSDHAVIDRDLNTLLVFTGLEIAAVPAHRARALRSLGSAMPHAGS